MKALVTLALLIVLALIAWMVRPWHGSLEVPPTKQQSDENIVAAADDEAATSLARSLVAATEPTAIENPVIVQVLEIGSDRPIAGVEFAPVSTTSWPVVRDDPARGLVDAVCRWPGMSVSVAATQPSAAAIARTDADGTCRLPAGQHYIGSRTGLSPCQLDLSGTRAGDQVAVRMSRSRIAVVTVLSATTAEPIESTLDLYRPVRNSVDGAPTDVWLSCGEQSLVGSIELALADGEAVALCTRAIGYRSSDWAVIPADEWQAGPVVIRLDPIPAVTGQVVDRTGSGIGGVRVVSRSGGSFASSYFARTAADGSFRVGISFGEVRVAVEDDRWAEVVSDPVSKGDQVVLTTHPRTRLMVGTTATWADGMPVQAGKVELRRVESGWKAPVPNVIGKIRDGVMLPIELAEGEYEVRAWSTQPPALVDTGCVVVAVQHDLGRSLVKAWEPRLMPIVLPRGGVIRCEADEVAWRGLTANGNSPALQLMSQRDGGWQQHATYRMREGDVVLFAGVAPGEYGVLTQPSKIVQAVKVDAGETANVALGAGLAAIPVAVFDRGQPVARCTVVLASADGRQGAAVEVHPGREAVAVLPSGTQWVANVRGPGMATVLAIPRAVGGVLRIDLPEGTFSVEGPPSSVTPAEAACLWLELEGVDLRQLPMRMRLQAATGSAGGAVVFERVAPGRIRIGVRGDLLGESADSTKTFTTTGTNASVEWER